MKSWEVELTELVERRGRALHGYATALCGNPRDAEDLVQDAVVKVFSRLRGPAGRRGPTATEDDGPGLVTLAPAARLENLEGYVRRTILTGYLDTYRRRQRWAGIRHLAARPDSVRSHESGTDDAADVTAALAVLTPMQRACVVLRFYSDLTVPRVAAELGCAEGTVKRHLHDANVALRGRLGVVDEVGSHPATTGPAPTPPLETTTPAAPASALREPTSPYARPRPTTRTLDRPTEGTPR